MERHVLQERRFARAGLADDIQVQKPVFVLYTEDALVAAKIDAGEPREMMCAHTGAYLPSGRLCARDGEFCRNDFHPDVKTVGLKSLDDRIILLEV